MDTMPTELYLGDHLGGFDQERKNILLDHIHYNLTNRSILVYHNEVATELVRKKYPKINFKLKLFELMWDAFVDYNIHPEIEYKNFICSFNGTPHVSRKLLVSILSKFNWFNTTYCSKNFADSSDKLAGHLADYLTPESYRLYAKFFNIEHNFVQTNNSFGHVRYDHSTNIYNLQDKLTQSFLNIVSESMATSYVPFVTEKFLYSIVTRGLFLSYAQPGWHNHVEKYYGFKRYTKLFDYQFDNIENPVERLVELMCMISKFSILSSDDWRDLYLIEKDTIEYNYDHYFSRRYLNNLKPYE